VTPDPSRHSEQSEIVPAIADDDVPPFEHLSDPSLLDDWSRRAQISIYAHNSAEVYFSRLDGLVTGVLLGGVVLLGQIALVVSTDSGFPKAVTAALTVVVAVIGALGLVWDFRTKATEHRFAARQYGAIRRALEVLRELDRSSPEAAWRREEIRRLWDAASATAPAVPSKLRARAQSDYVERRIERRSTA
jgi:hypothetical protein